MDSRYRFMLILMRVNQGYLIRGASGVIVYYYQNLAPLEKKRSQLVILAPNSLFLSPLPIPVFYAPTHL